MSIKVSIFTFLFIGITTGCGRYPVSGTVNMHGSDFYPMIYLIDPLSFNALLSSFEGKIIDSAAIDHKGHFRFEKMPTSAENKIFVLAIQKKGEVYKNRLVDVLPDSSNYLPFIYHSSSDITITTSSHRMLYDAVIQSGIKENGFIAQLIKKRADIFRNSMSTWEHGDATQLLEREKKLLEYQKSIIGTISGQDDPLILGLALRWISTNHDYERISDLVKSICVKLQTTAPNHPWTHQICQKSANLPPTLGDVFPDFPLPMLQGDTTNVYKLLGSRLTLIDLWASWCAPCRKENKSTLVPLWEQNHTLGFQIIGYALDADKKGWQNAIEKDGVDRWPHASHLQGDVSPLFDKLKMTTIPANYLVDHKGIILAKNLHGGDLVNFVHKYLNN